MTPPLHIGLLASDLRLSHGWGSYSRNLIEGLRDAGMRLTVVASRNTPQVPGVDILPILPSLNPRDRWMLPRLFTLRPWVRDVLRDCDVIHATVEPFAPLAALASLGRPMFITGHGSYVRVYHAWRWPASRVYARAFLRSTLVCVSHYTARAAQDELPGVRTIVVNNGVDATRFMNLPPLQQPKTGPTVLAVGAVKPRKGALELVQAMAVVHQQIPEARAVVIGDLTLQPDYVARVRAEIVAHGLQDSVQLLGRVPDETLLAWYGAADVFALPSLNAGWKFEGYGLALLEASAAGLPVISTSDCGAEDAVDEGETGLLVPQESVVDGLAGAIVGLLGDPERARRMGEAGRHKALQQTWGHVARRMIELYQESVRA